MDARFRYAPKLASTLVGLLIGGGMAAFGAWSLATGAVIARRGNTLSPEFSTGVWILVLVVGLVLLVGGVQLVLAGTRTVVVTHDALDAPRRLTSKRVERVPIAAITDATLAADPVHGQMLRITVRDGKPIWLARRCFDDAEAFVACGNAIAHARRARQG